MFTCRPLSPAPSGGCGRGASGAASVGCTSRRAAAGTQHADEGGEWEGGEARINAVLALEQILCRAAGAVTTTLAPPCTRPTWWLPHGAPSCSAAKGAPCSMGCRNMQQEGMSAHSMLHLAKFESGRGGGRGGRRPLRSPHRSGAAAAVAADDCLPPPRLLAVPWKASSCVCCRSGAPGGLGCRPGRCALPLWCPAASRQLPAGSGQAAAAGPPCACDRWRRGCCSRCSRPDMFTASLGYAGGPRRRCGAGKRASSSSAHRLEQHNWVQTRAHRVLSPANNLN